MKTKYMPRKRINNRRLKRARSRLSMKRFTIVFLLGVLLVLGMIFSGWVRWKQTELVYHINQINKQKEELLEERKWLLMELYKLQSPERAASIARNQLGMEIVTFDRITIVDSEIVQFQMSDNVDTNSSIDPIALSTDGGGGR